ncbi:type III pantothenate kinase [Candidatus Sumerlaeota bacterium]|nr:type III pantothenate kinase [Candidatus Sumerlaeota bacterium]
MILVVNVGNTHIHLGLFTRGVLRGTWKLSTDPRRTADEYAFLLHGLLGENTSFDGAIISSVVPPITHTLKEAVAKNCHVKPMVLTSRTEIGIVNGYRHPEEVGMDRLANAVGGNYFFGAPLLILDYGTAVTLDYVAASEPPGGKPVYKGGAIMPGLRMAAEALGRGTSKLPTIELIDPEKVIGGTTIESIRSGLVHGYLGAVTTLVDRARDEIGGDCRVVATGGDALWFKDRLPFLSAADPNLTLFGLRQIYGINNDCPLPPYKG